MMMPRPPPWGHPEGPPRHFFNDHPPIDIYAGPEAYMEVGTRGFLVCTLAGKEEFGVDDAIDLLRQATIKLYGGIKPTFKKVPAKKGYVKIDFMDPEAVMILPTPEGEETEEEKVEEPAKPEDTEKEKEGEGKSEETKAEDSEKKPDVTEKMEEGEGSEEKQEEEKDAEKAGDSESKGKEAADKTSDNKEETEAGEKDEQKEEESKKEVQKEEEKKEEVQHMRTPYKFKAFRTDIRNNFFIKSNVPDPMKVAETAMEIIIERKSIAGDAVSQLLPVLGVCKHDYHQLEVMTRRVLAPILDETLEPKGFSVLLIDKHFEPGSEVLIEAVRNAVWSVNPQAWQSSPLTEPDIVIRVELLGSKLVLCCLTNFMRYRHYSPKLIVQMGVGEAEDDDGTYISVEERRRQAALREQREKQRELERQREEERRKEREKRRAEAEARRAEAEAKRRAEAEARRKEREKNREKKKREEEEEKKKEKSKEEEGDKDEKKEKKAEEAKADDETKGEEEEKMEEQANEEEEAEEKAAEKRGGGRRRRSQNAASPPKKKAKVETSKVETSEAEAENEPEEEENEEEMEESEEVEEEEGKGRKKKGKTTTPRGKKGGRRKTKK